MKEIVIVTGGAKGLGLELVRELVKRDYRVCNIDWDQEALGKVQEELGENHFAYLGDVSDENFVKETVEKIQKKGTIIALINNAGEPSFKVPIEYTNQDIDQCFKGLKGMILFSTQVLKAMKEENLKIVNIMSSAALRGNKQESVYCATKWGEKGYTESLKSAYKGTSVKIIGVYPGGINTSFYENSRDYVSIEKQQKFMDPKEVANIILTNVFPKENLTIADIMIERNS